MDPGGLALKLEIERGRRLRKCFERLNSGNLLC